MPDATIHIDWAESITELAANLRVHLPASHAAVPIVPGPVSSDDPHLSRLRAAWRSLGNPTTLLLPRPTPAALLRRSWRRVDIPGGSVRIDARMTNTQHVAVLMLTEQLRQGPFLLDLPVAYLHPADRLRLEIRPQASRLHADVFAHVMPTAIQIITPLNGGWLAISTTDAIAGELWCLGLAERWLDPDLEMQGPWEDPTLQRATELELGIRIPREMQFGGIPVHSLPAEARMLLLSIASRLGMPAAVNDR